MKKLIFISAYILLSLGAYSQARLSYVEAGTSFGIKFSGTEEHTFTSTTYTGDIIDANDVNTTTLDATTVNGTNINLGGTALGTLFAPASGGVTNGDSHDHNGGDGAQIAHSNLSGIGTNTHAQIDAAVTASTNHIADNTNPHGSTLQQGIIYSISGNITTSSATTVWYNVPDNAMAILTCTAAHNHYSSTSFGYGVWLITRNWNSYNSAYEMTALPLFTESYSNQIDITFSGDDMRITYNLASASHPLYYTTLRLN